MKYYFYYFLMFLIIPSGFFAQVISNGDFENGAGTGWTQYSQGNYRLIGTASDFSSTEISPAVVPHSGQYMARIGGFSYEINSIKQTITLPKTSKVYMGMFVQSRSSNTSECAGLWVGAQIRVYAKGQELSSNYLCNYNDLTNWTYVYYDLSAAAGETIEIGFRADAANSVWSFLYIDDVSISSTVSVPEDKIHKLEYQLNQNYPNPFNPETMIGYQLSAFSKVQLKVYDVLGREINTLVDREQDAGKYEVKFDASNLPSGTYFYRLQAGNFVEFKKMMILK